MEHTPRPSNTEPPKAPPPRPSWLRTTGVGLAGVLTGILLALQIPAFADKPATTNPTAGLPIQDLRTFAEVFNAIKQGYVEPVDDKKMISNAIAGMVSNLDPHSAYLDTEAFKDLKVGTQGEFGGLGIEVGMEDGYVKVISPIEDTPAARAGLKTGDLIVKIDDTLVKGLTLNDAVKKLRGKPQTPVTITVVRKGLTKPLVLTLTREIIKVQSVKAKLVEPGYGYVRITQFQETTTANLAQAIRGFYKDGPLKGFILDLRNDPGGLLNAAVGVSATFLSTDKLVVYTEGRTPDAKHKYYAKPEDYQDARQPDILRDLPPGIKTVPMIVLVNGGSASASEIVSGALQDYKRATILGTRTFGKGSVQSILELPNNTAIKLTTARYYTPEGRSIQAKGIDPDVEVEETPGAKPNNLREADLGGHLANLQDKDAEKAEKAEKDKADKKDGAAKDDNPGLVIADYTTAKDRQFVEAIKRLGGKPPAPVATADAAKNVPGKDSASAHGHVDKGRRKPASAPPPGPTDAPATPAAPDANPQQ